MNKMYVTLKIFTIAVFSVILFSCSGNNNMDLKDKTVFKGKVFDINTQVMLRDIEIKIGNISVYSNSKGEFLVDNLIAGEEYMMSIRHKDYVEINKKITLTDVSKNMSATFSLIKRNEKQIFNTRDTITVKYENNGIISFKANSFINNLSMPYNGKIGISVTFINPVKPKMILGSPANFIALESGKKIPLKTFGMIEILATDSAGNRLDINKPAKINFPIIDSITTGTGFYHLDLSTGYWIREGILSFDKVSYSMLGEVTSISSAWNADQPCSEALVCVRIRVVDELGNPSPRYVGAIGLSYNGYYSPVSPDAQGYAELYVCPNSVFQITDDIIPCCNNQIPGTPEYQFCCENGGLVRGPIIDMSTVTLTPPCTDIGQVTFP